jgi:formylglycine-generating enzyme required for sulfatase activity
MPPRLKLNPHLFWTFMGLMILALFGCEHMNMPELRFDVDRTSTRTPTKTKLIANPDFSGNSWKKIIGGQARCGSLRDEPGRDPILEQLKTIDVSDFEISTYEVTRGQFFHLMEPARRLDPTDMDVPITNITYHEAEQFCQLLTIKANVIHRLPTEAEWEYACRASRQEMFNPWKGNCSLADAIKGFQKDDPGKLIRGIQATCNVNTGQLLPVGRFSPNSFGLFDMHGNCNEWCSIEDTLSPAPSPLHAPIRGGSGFSTQPLECRAAKRAWQPMNKPAQSIGFRIVREIPTN